MRHWLKLYFNFPPLNADTYSVAQCIGNEQCMLMGKYTLVEIHKIVSSFCLVHPSVSLRRKKNRYLLLVV